MKIVYTLIALCFSILLNAQKAGTLDSSFGVDGKVITTYNSGTTIPWDAVMQKDGTIVMSGEGDMQTEADTTSGLIAVRYKTDGNLDSSFGINGKIVHNFGYETSPGTAVAIQDDGKIVIAGWLVINPFDFDQNRLVITRLLADGKTDSSFGVNGDVVNYLGGWPVVTDMLIQPDGKIVIAGKLTPDFFIIRYTSEGKLDSSFGNNGYQLTHFGGISSINSIVLQPDGKILAGGNDDQVTAFARYMPDGNLDKTFGVNGTVVKSFGPSYSAINSVALNSDGSFIAAGSVGNGFNGNMLIAKFNADGSLNENFGNQGSMVFKFNSLDSKAVTTMIQKDSKIVIAGYTFKAFGPSINAFAVLRFMEDGSTDSTFGTQGVTQTDFDPDFTEVSLTGFLSKDHITCMGYSPNYNLPIGNTTLLARYNNDDVSRKQIIIQKIKHYIQTHNDAQATILNKVFVYPNPAQSILHIDGLSSSQKTKLIVVDFNGNIAISQQLSANSYSCNLNIASLHAGNYLLKIETNGEVVTKQFVKE